jgi:two-component system, NtrC family, response regulator HydG
VRVNVVAHEFPEYWKTIVDTMMDGVVVVDGHGAIRSVNKALENMMGYHASELIGKDCSILDCDSCFVCNGRDKKDKQCELMRTGTVVKRRCRLTRKDGSAVHVLKNGAVLADKSGAIVGGVETITDITDLVRKEQTIEELKELLSPEEGFQGIVGRSPKMLDVYALIRNASASDAPIIIYGESGTGKELVANAIHKLGKRSKGPFVKVNCAALNESLLESELFGHVKGAFTGADRERKGRFEASHKGDLFLDEIGDIPFTTQVKLLRVLQEKEIERVGDHTPVPINVRIMAATHRDLKAMCANGTFREDLYYRLNVIPIYVPSLRERRDDVPLLIDHIGKTIGMRTGKDIHGVTQAAMDILVSYDWPGNVRELVNVLEYAFVVCHEDLISPRHLPSFSTATKKLLIYDEGTVSKGKQSREDLMGILEKTGGNRQEAARLLGVSRVTLWKLLKKHNIAVRTYIGADSTQVDT